MDIISLRSNQHKLRKVKVKYYDNSLKCNVGPVDAFFHQWAAACLEGNDNNFGNYTVAIVELPDGKIIEVLPGNVEFMS